MPRRDVNAVTVPNLGLYLDRPPGAVPKRGLVDCLNVRAKNGIITNLNMGWERFGAFTLNGPLTLIDNFFLRAGGQILIFGTLKDLYKFDEGTTTVDFITPITTTGTVEVVGGDLDTVVGAGTTWNTTGSNKLKVGDEIYVGTAGETDPDAALNGGWHEITAVTDDTHVDVTPSFSGAVAASTVYTARKVFVGTIFDYWRTETFPKAQPADEDEWWATNGGVDYGVSWNGTDAQVSVESALAFKFKEIGRFKHMMVYGNLLLDSGETRPNSIRNSAIGAPANVSTLEANEFIVNDGVDPIVGIFPLGDNLIIYGDRSATITQFVGVPLIFVFRTAIAGIGPLTGRLIADFGDFHEFLAADAAYRFDGIAVTEVGFHIWREFLRTQDPKRITLGFSHFDEENGDLLWAMPLTTDADTVDGQPETAIVEHYLEDVGERNPVPHTKRTLKMSASGFFDRLTTLTWDSISDQWQQLNFRWNDQFFQASFPFNMVGDELGKLYTLNTIDTHDGAAVNSFARFRRITLVDGRNKGLLKRIYPFARKLVSATYTLDVRIKTTDHPAGDLVTEATEAFDLTHAGKHFVSPFIIARYTEIEFGTSGPDQPFELEGYDFDAVAAGEQ